MLPNFDSVVDLSSHGVTDEIQLGSHFDNLGTFIYVQISAIIIENHIIFNIGKSMHDTVTKMVVVLSLISLKVCLIMR